LAETYTVGGWIGFSEKLVRPNWIAEQGLVVSVPPRRENPDLFIIIGTQSRFE
jgi:hypothetical protein